MALMGESSTGQRLRMKRTVTSSTTVTGSDDVILADCTTGPITVTLPLGASRTLDVTVKKTDATSNTVTIAPTNPNTIDGKASVFLTGATMPSVTLTPSSAGWYIL